MSKNPNEENDSLLIKSAADLLVRSKKAVAFTGAGISTHSGIPDFRSADSGLWNRYNPFQVASLHAFRDDPESFFNWIKPLAETAELAEPNPAHTGLAKMEKAGIIQAVITQNIDGLHQKAGSEKVLELHGSARTATCRNCGRIYNEDYFKQTLLKDDLIPVCANCGTIIKPDVVLFGEMLPEDAWDAAFRLCQKSDCLIVVGSSLEVSPANTLPQTAVQNGAHLIINNLSPTPLDGLADIILQIDVAEGIEKIWQEMRSG